jgi:hypothetical protein
MWMLACFFVTDRGIKPTKSAAHLPPSRARPWRGGPPHRSLLRSVNDAVNVLRWVALVAAGRQPGIGEGEAELMRMQVREVDRAASHDDLEDS